MDCDFQDARAQYESTNDAIHLKLLPKGHQVRRRYKPNAERDTDSIDSTVDIFAA